ncbi:Type IV fimbrial biogenesis protein PilY1 [Labilithrix luteola]|uniref:Type IV fimbrial biogenesis protein PilY1 n=1 Tax=Labilithrix luteola TaxID=1391654 RepID=A0A0K1PN71_9BACT|nr:hypothetical protein [Labilithrix luteola]AKU94962.1 Type IV fimbrial biogenesis protein PilY1 [Labilithrix luteola]
MRSSFQPPKTRAPEGAGTQASPRRIDGTQALLSSSVAFGLAVLACAVASCAESDGATAPLDSGASTLPELDASSDAAPGANCLDAGDGGGCEPRALSCAEADFCEVPTGVEGRNTLLDVWGSSAQDVWAVGSGGTVIHWDGAAWTRVPIPWKDTLRSVGGSGVSDVWIVSSLNVVLHSSGFGTAAGFKLQPLLYPVDPTNRSGAILSKVWASGAGNLFVGGDPWISAPSVPSDSLWRFRFGASADQAWEPVSTFCRTLPCGRVDGIWGTSASDVWVVGENGAVRRSKGPVGDGGAEQWSTMETTRTTADLHGIWGSSASDVWIVGDRGTIRHWSNDASQSWAIVPSSTTRDLRAVWGTGPSDAWAVGDGGTILHWDGASWRSVTTTLPAGSQLRLNGVWGSGLDDVWVVGEAVALHFGSAKAVAVPVADGGPR